MKPDIPRLEQALCEERRLLLAQIAQQRGGVVSRAEVAAAHREEQSDDWGQAEADRELEYTLSERETAELNEIDAALRRIALGEYGQCVDCAGAIPAARLQANPRAARCINCQEQMEKLG